MKDQRISVLAKNLVNYSIKLQKGEKLLIDVWGKDTSLAQEIVKEAYNAGGYPIVSLKDSKVLRAILNGASKESMQEIAKHELSRMKDMDAYISIRGGENINELSDVKDEKMTIYMEDFMGPVHIKERVANTKWCVMRWANESMAQAAGTSTEAFEDFFFNVCNLDYNKMSKAMDPLVELMNKTDKVRIVGEGTDLTFSIKGIGAIKCDGAMNIPDGEVYTAPVKDSVNGVITYNAPSLYNGFTYENIKLTFKDGKIVEAIANDSERINKVFDTDEGARFIGEFAIGVNPYILKPMKDILFDEKIMGSFHFTPGNSYPDAYNGNNSSVHWDLVCIQTPEYGGGEIYFDDVLIRKDGKFVVSELEGLNPENLK